MNGTITLILTNDQEQELQISNNGEIDLSGVARALLPFNRNDLTEITFDGEKLELTLEGGTQLTFDNFIQENGVMVPLIDPSGTLIFSNISALLEALQATAAGNQESELGNGSGFFPAEEDTGRSQENANSYRNLRDTSTGAEGDTEEGQGGTTFLAAPNIAPVASDDEFSFNEIQQESNQLFGNLLLNDTDFDSNAELAVTSVNGVALTGSFVTVTLESGVQVTVFSNGLFTVTNYEVHGDLAGGEVVTENFVYEVSDGLDASEAQVSVTVTGTNDIPVISFNEGENLGQVIEDVTVLSPKEPPEIEEQFIQELPLQELPDIKATGQLSVFDPDNGATATWSVTAPDGKYGILSINQSGVWSYALYRGEGENAAGVQALNSGQVETETFTVVVTDDQSATDEAQITITVTGTNDQPAVSNPRVSYASDEVTNGLNSFTNLALSVATDADAEDTDLTYHPYSQGVSTDNLLAKNLSVTVNLDGTFDLSGDFNALAAGEKATVSFQYYVDDNNGFNGLNGLDEQSASAPATASITVTGTNDLPTVKGIVKLSLSEDRSSLKKVSLLKKSADIDDSDELNVDFNTMNLIRGDDTGIDFNQAKNQLIVDPAKYQYLALGETETIVYSYTITDGNGGTVAQKVRVKVKGQNDAPEITVETGDSIAEALTETNTGLDITGTLSVTDVDISDIVSASVSAVSATGFNNGIDSPALQAMMSVSTAPVIDGNNDHGTLNWSFNSNSEAFDYLGLGESLELTYTLQVSDDATPPAIAQQTVTVTINGSNDTPTVSTPLSKTLNEDARGIKKLNLLKGAEDDDLNDTLHIENLIPVSGDASGISQSRNGNKLLIDPADYQHLAIGEKAVVIFSYDVVDNHGASVSQTATVTINGRNDTPTVDGIVKLTLNEDRGSIKEVSLLENVSDLDTSDVLRVKFGTMELISGNDEGISFDRANNMLQVDPDAYQYLAAGETEVVKYTYTVADGHGGKVQQNAKIVIKGRNDAPEISVQSGDSRKVILTEDDSAQTVTGTLSVTDVDLSDIVTAKVASLSIKGNSGVLNPFDLLDMLSVDATAVIGANSDTGTINWSFDSSNETFDYLGDQESLVLTYRIRATDDSADKASDRQTVKIVVNGSNDGPVITAVPVDTFATVQESNSGISVEGSFGVEDLDLSDSVSASVNLTDIKGSDNGLGSAALEAMMEVSPTNIIASGATTGTLNWDFDSGTEAFDYLAVGEALQLTFTVTVDDGLAQDTQTVTITVQGTNDDPQVVGKINKWVNEDRSAIRVIDLLEKASDADVSDTLSVESVQRLLGNPAGVTLDGNTLRIDAHAYQNLDAGDRHVLKYRYDIVDGHGGVVTQTARIVIIGENDVPTVRAVTRSYSEDIQGNKAIKLLNFAKDVDDDASLSITSVTLRNTGADDSGVRLNNAGNKLIITPSEYDYLAEGEQEQLIYEFVVSDGLGGDILSTATINIVGHNDQPEILEPAISIIDIDEAATGLNTLTGIALSSADDADTSDTLEYYQSGIASSSNNAITDLSVTVHKGGTFDLSGDFNGLADGEIATVSFSYYVSDGNRFDGANGVDEKSDSDLATVSITVTGGNEAPVIASLTQFQDKADTFTGKTTLLVNTDARWTNGDIIDPDNTDSRNTLTIADGDNAPAISDISFSKNLKLSVQEIDTLKAAITLGVKETNRGGDSISLDYDKLFYFLPAGVNATISVTYMLADSFGALSNQATATLLVNGTDQPTLLKNDIYTNNSTKLFENGADADFDILANDVDPDLGDLRLLNINQNKHVTLRDGANETSDEITHHTLHNGTVSRLAGQLHISNLDQFDYLQKGESDYLHVTYRTKDKAGAVHNAKAVVKIEGTNDLPELTLNVTNINSPALAASGTLSISDVDIKDIVTAKLVNTVSVSGDVDSLDARLSQLKVMLRLLNDTDAEKTSVIALDNTETTGSVNWAFETSNRPAAFDNLQSGEQVTLTYQVYAQDNKGGFTPINEINIIIDGVTGGGGEIKSVTTSQSLLTAGNDQILLSEVPQSTPLDAFKGQDTLLIDPTEQEQVLDFDLLSANLSNFEQIDLGTGDATSRLINISAEDVLSMSSGKKLTILGDENDEVILDQAIWTPIANQTDAYTNIDSGAKLIIDADIHVIPYDEPAVV